MKAITSNLLRQSSADHSFSQSAAEKPTLLSCHSHRVNVNLALTPIPGREVDGLVVTSTRTNNDEITPKARWNRRVYHAQPSPYASDHYVTTASQLKIPHRLIKVAFAKSRFAAYIFVPSMFPRQLDRTIRTARSNVLYALFLMPFFRLRQVEKRLILFRNQ